jgi:hypothetical protein
MRYLVPFCLLTILPTLPLRALPPLAVAQVVREGQPPYEDDERRYRLEGDGCGQLHQGQMVLLVRPGAARLVGQLEVVAVHPDYALARLRRSGAGFPMKGDLAVPLETLQPLPGLPTVGQPLAPSPGLSAPPAAPALPVPALGGAHLEPIFFLPEATTLTPGAQAKLKAWVKAWGRAGRWMVALPPPDSPLAAARVRAVHEELLRLGARRVEEGRIDQSVTGPYPAVFVILNPC